MRKYIGQPGIFSYHVETEKRLSIKKNYGLKERQRGKRMKRFYVLIAFGLILLIGIIVGAVLQKDYGVGNLMRGMGVPYPTQIPISLPAYPAAVEIPLDHQGEISLFILAGQSNMVGWAPLPEQQETDLMIYVFGNDYRWRVAVEPVDDPYEQVDQISLDQSAAFGPSLAFASAVRSKRPEMVIGLIPCAKNSSAIIEWQRNLSDQSLYGSCLKRARAASQMGRFAGVLFFQGETDTIDGNLYPQFDPHAAEWSVLFSSFVNNLREDLHEPELPVVFAQIGADPYPEEESNWELVKEQQRSIRLQNVAMITTDDLPSMDGLHFTTDSYRRIGERFAAAYLELMDQHND
jgi:hypothetical protein